MARLVSISSTDVCGVPDETPIRENHRLRGVGAHGRSEIDAEQLCNDARAAGQCPTAALGLFTESTLSSARR
jgi:UDP-glucose 4-epimerase